MAEEFHLFPEQYQTNVEFLELQNDDDFSGVELLKVLGLTPTIYHFL